MNKSLPLGYRVTDSPTSPSWQVFERGWLSSNNILLMDKNSTALVDTGYCTHSEQTLLLVQSALGGQPLNCIINTHLHSDHCGGNAALQAAYGAQGHEVETLIPSGLAQHVAAWDEEQLSYQPTGQNCPRFGFHRTLQQGDELMLGGASWQVHAAPGHDPHSIILFEPQHRTLISADALWQNGFGVVFQELEGEQAFDEVAQTLDVIECLNPSTVIPGHGAVFSGDAVRVALAGARARLNGFAQNPLKHTRYAVKVLLKYKLLELQTVKESAFMEWAKRTPYFEMVRSRWFDDEPMNTWVSGYINELISSGAAKREGDVILNV